MKVDMTNQPNNIVNADNNVNNVSSNSLNPDSAAARKPGVPETFTQSQEPAKTNAFPRPEDLEKALGKVKEKLNEIVDVGFEYFIDKDTNREVVKIIDRRTNEVIRQYPPEEILNMLKRMDEMLGFFVDERL